MLESFPLFSQFYLDSGNLEMVSLDADKGKYLLRYRQNSLTAATGYYTNEVKVFRNSDKKLIAIMPSLTITNPPNSNDPTTHDLPNLRCDSNLVNSDYLEIDFDPHSHRESIYEGTITLDPDQYSDPQGYTLTIKNHSQMTNNQEYTNLDRYLPPVPPVIASSTTIITLVLSIPPQKVAGKVFKNSSPEFGPYQREFLCRGKPFSMIVGCKDPDNDQLRFSFTTPFAQFIPDAPSTTLDNLQLQRFNPGYSINNMIDGNISIDAKTGLISILPTKWGTYLTCVKIEEIRDNKVIGVSYRYYSFQVRECKKADDPQPKLTASGYPIGTNNITVCKGQPITLTAQNNSNWAYEWSRDGILIPEGKNASITVQDEGLYEVKVKVKYPILTNGIEEGCSNINRERININVLGTVGAVKLTGEKTFCNGGFSVLSAPVKSNVLYQWYKDGVAIVATNSDTYQANQVGKYYVALTEIASPTCPSISDTLALELRADSPKINITSDEGKKQLCQEGGQIVLRVNSTDSQTIKWFKDDIEISEQTSNSYILNQPGKYTVELKDNITQCIVSGEALSITLAPKPNAIITSINNQHVICEGDSLALSTVVLPKGQYHWQLNGVDIPKAIQSTFFSKSKGDYLISVQDSSGCKNVSNVFSLDIVSKITVTLNPLQEICEDSNLITLMGFPTNGQYSGKGIEGDKFNPKVSGAGTFKITYSITTGMQCQQGIAEQLVTVNPLPKPTALPSTLIINKGNSTILNSGNIAGYKYQWTPVTYLDAANKGNPISTPDQNIEYTVKIISDKGCSADGKISIIITSKILIPTAFTPNDDGENDTWKLFGIENYPASEVSVYNRWGEIVYFSKGYFVPFNGKYPNGVDLPTDSYAYIIKVIGTSLEQYELKGSVVILR